MCNEMQIFWLPFNIKQNQKKLLLNILQKEMESIV